MPYVGTELRLAHSLNFTTSSNKMIETPNTSIFDRPYFFCVVFKRMENIQSREVHPETHKDQT